MERKLFGLNGTNGAGNSWVGVGFGEWGVEEPEIRDRRSEIPWRSDRLISKSLVIADV
jgi:hypothetical protein